MSLDTASFISRAQSALATSKASAILDKLLTEGDSHCTAMRDEADALAQKVLSPDINIDEARTARKQGDDLTFEAQRFNILMDQLRDRSADIKKVEAEASARKEYAAARQDRDRLVEVLRDRWPKLAREMISILVELKENDARLAQVNPGKTGDDWLLGAEDIARGAAPGWRLNPGWGIAGFTDYHAGVRLPDFSANPQSPSGIVWPPAGI